MLVVPVVEGVVEPVLEGKLARLARFGDDVGIRRRRLAGEDPVRPLLVVAAGVERRAREVEVRLVAAAVQVGGRRRRPDQAPVRVDQPDVGASEDGIDRNGPVRLAVGAAGLGLLLQRDDRRVAVGQLLLGRGGGCGDRSSGDDRREQGDRQRHRAAHCLQACRPRSAASMRSSFRSSSSNLVSSRCSSVSSSRLCSAWRSLARPGDERGGDRGRDDRQEGDPVEHDDGCDQPARPVGGGDVAVADGRHRLDPPPHADPDARVLLAVENADEDAADHDNRGSGDDDGRDRAAHGRGLAQELRHPTFDRVRTRHGGDVTPAAGSSTRAGQRRMYG